MIVHRDAYLNKLVRKKNNGLVKIVTGIRRCGKSFLLMRFFKEHLIKSGIKEENIISLDLELNENRKYRNPDDLSYYLNSKLQDKEGPCYVLIDEAQMAISKKELSSDEPIRLYGILSSLINRLNVDVYLTCSNSKFLSSDISTEFRGRSDEVKVYPLTFSEYYHSGIQKDKMKAWRDYSTYGGLPFLLSLSSPEDKIQYLDNLFDNVYFKDVVDRYTLHGDTVLSTLTDILASDIGSLTNPIRLANTFSSHGIKVSNVTIASDIEHLIDAYLIKKAKRYDVKGKRYIDSPFKYYFTDIGLRNSRLKFSQQEPTHIMENIIFNELIARGYDVDIGIVEKNIKKEGKQVTLPLEIDFVCSKGNKRFYIQSAYSIPDKEKMKQETASLDRIGDSFQKIIVTQDNSDPWYTDKGYLVINLLDFLLGEESL